MSSQTMVAVSIPLTAECQMAYCSGSTQTMTTIKNNHLHPTQARISHRQDSFLSKPIQIEKTALSELYMESREPGFGGPELSGRDSNEQFTRMSCCP